jgi:hypothetical protein
MVQSNPHESTASPLATAYLGNEVTLTRKAELLFGRHGHHRQFLDSLVLFPLYSSVV